MEPEPQDRSSRRGRRSPRVGTAVGIVVLAALAAAGCGTEEAVTDAGGGVSEPISSVARSAEEGIPLQRALLGVLASDGWRPIPDLADRNPPVLRKNGCDAWPASGEAGAARLSADPDRTVTNGEWVEPGPETWPELLTATVFSSGPELSRCLWIVNESIKPLSVERGQIVRR